MISKEELKVKALELLPASVNLNYVDYNDDLDEHPKLFQQIIDKKTSDYVFENEDIFSDGDNVFQALNYHREELIKDLASFYGCNSSDIEFLIDEEINDSIRDQLHENDTSDVFKDLLKNTSDIYVRVEMNSNYDCINSHYHNRQTYEYKESYFGDMVDVLNLNPAKVKKMLLANNCDAVGAFPNKPNRDGKEQVKYEDLFVELENSCCGANLLTFVAKMDASDFYDYKEGKIKIPKGNDVGLYSSFNGGGSVISMELQNDFLIDLTKSTKNGRSFKLVVDQADGYSIDSCYGPTSKFWGDYLSMI